MPKVYYITKWWNTSFELNQFLCRVRIDSILFPSRKSTTIFCRSATLSTSASAATWPAHCRTLIVPTWFSTSAFTYVYKILMYKNKSKIYLVSFSVYFILIFFHFYCYWSWLLPENCWFTNLRLRIWALASVHWRKLLTDSIKSLSEHPGVLPSTYWYILLYFEYWHIWKFEKRYG